MTIWAIAPRNDSVYGICIPWTCSYTRKGAWEYFVRWMGHKDTENFRAIKVRITRGPA